MRCESQHNFGWNIGSQHIAIRDVWNQQIELQSVSDRESVAQKSVGRGSVMIGAEEWFGQESERNEAQDTAPLG